MGLSTKPEGQGLCPAGQLLILCDFNREGFMKDQLLPILRERYPIIFGDQLREIECCQGWLELLDNLGRSIQDHMNKHPDVLPVRAVRIKEKWGELRFHHNGGDKSCREIVAAAVADSLTICEICGKSGELELVSRKWYGVRCPEHRWDGRETDVL
jgi:hypothetical protein